MSKNKIETLANYSVILIALLALIVSFWQVKLFQDHNKLTVKPYLDSHLIQEDSILIISFSNKGLGPAIIKEMTFEINNKKYATIFELLNATGDQNNRIRTFNYPENSVISSGEKKLIVKLRNPKFRGIRVKIIYESIYKETGEMNFSF